MASPLIHRLTRSEQLMLAGFMGARLLVRDTARLRTRGHGWESLDLLAALSLNGQELLVVNIPVPSQILFTYPTIRLYTDREQVKHDEWPDIDRVAERLVDIREQLGAAGISVPADITVSGASIVRDTVAWTDRETGCSFHVSTDIGVLLTLSSMGYFLCMAKDSEGGLLQYAYVPSYEDLAWWFSEEGVHDHWGFDTRTECGQDVSVSERVLVPCFRSPCVWIAKGSDGKRTVLARIQPDEDYCGYFLFLSFSDGSEMDAWFVELETALEDAAEHYGIGKDDWVPQPPRPKGR